jgi:hypothetical protein
MDHSRAVSVRVRDAASEWGASAPLPDIPPVDAKHVVGTVQECVTDQLPASTMPVEGSVKGAGWITALVA